MAMDKARRNALLSSRRECGAVIGPLADRVLWELAHHRDANGGPILNSGHELSELKGLPSDLEKISTLWALITKKGMRGWDVLVAILGEVAPQAREILEGKVEESGRLDPGYFSQANTPSDNQVLGVSTWHQEPSSELSSAPPPVLALLPSSSGPHNETQAAYENGRQHMAYIKETPIECLRNSIKNDTYGVGGKVVESAGAHSVGPTVVVGRTPLNRLSLELVSTLAQELNPNKDFLVVVGQELGAPDHILKVCQRTGNPTGMLLSNVQNGVTLDDLHVVLNRHGRNDIWNKLLTIDN